MGKCSEICNSEHFQCFLTIAMRERKCERVDFLLYCCGVRAVILREMRSIFPHRC
ncbi:hypothetical protein J4Q44_G00181050 [Coregonus suidteri]|uniref:Uncharacterized protein n=1 Tax=Coregonus suidteri TaxID=861788 RepID=A0AAN8QV30_9TELE